MLTIALPKGRMADTTLALMEKCGVDISVMDGSRKLIYTDEKSDVSFLMVKPSDVPTYVHYGVADMGVAGKDTLTELKLPLLEMLDLKFGECRMCVAGYNNGTKKITSSILRVATKYPETAKAYYASKGETIEIIKLNGSVEIAPILGLSDVIVDLVESGNTLKENGLSVLEVIYRSSARLAVNRVSLKTKQNEIMPLLEKLRAVV